MSQRQSMPEQSHLAGAVFISYCSQDAPAAERICEALRAADVEVWLDKNELRGGDAWDAQIKKRIHECALFIPLISAHTNARSEGYFRREWKQATRRLQDMADDVAFLVPVVIDETREADARVPEEFLRAQWTWLPGGETPPAFAQRVRQLLGGDSAAEHAASSAIFPQIESNARVAYLHNRRAPPVRLVVSALIALLALGAGAFWYIQGARDAPAAKPVPATATPIEVAAPNEKSIAVLPFADMSAEKNQEYMSDGIAEELLNLLAQVPDLKVIARTSSFAFKGQNIEVSEIAKRLNVAHVLEGSVRTSGKQMRITAQLVRAADSTHLWSERYDRPMDDIFTVQDEIANAIVQALQIRFAGGTLSQRDGGTENLEAYQLYLRARSAHNMQTPASFEAAEDYLKDALELDPNFGQAWSRLATVTYDRSTLGGLNTLKMYELVQKYAERALQVSPNIAEAHAHLMALYAVRDFDWPAVEREGRLALAIDPNDALTLSYIAVSTSFLYGRHEEAVRLQKLAIARDPENLTLLEGLANLYYASGRYAESERLDRSILEQQPDRIWVRAGLSATLLMQGEAQAALAMLEQEPDLGARLAWQPIILQAAGHQADADEAFKKQIEHWASEYPVAIARTYAYRGDNDRALEWLERAYRQKDSGLLVIVDEPLFKNVADDPRFKAFVRDKLKLPQRS
jgi:TolB-like protein